MLLNEPVLESRYTIVTYNECKEFVEDSTNAACLGDCYYRIKDQYLIRSRTPVEMIQTHVTREDHYTRIDNIILQMTQSGLIINPDPIFSKR